MCTVTFVKTATSVIITSNRDEKLTRPPSSFPIAEKNDDYQIHYAKDPKANGTWLATDNKGRVVVLLNGAFIRHISSPPYRKSRGLILLELFRSDDLNPLFQKMDLHGIEPFQLLYYENKTLFRLVWDGKIKTILPLDASVNYIFSSVTLYDLSVIKTREKLFHEYIAAHPLITPELIMHFHTAYKLDDSIHRLMLHRESEAKTYSVSQILIQNKKSIYVYLDTISGKKEVKVIPFLENEI